MNTNSNKYTVIYTTIVCVLVAAILAFVSQVLKPKQEANEKAETISQILTAAQFGEKSEWEAKGNDAILSFYKEKAASAILVDEKGSRCGSLDINKAEIYTVSDLKAQNYNIKGGKQISVPVYIFNNGVAVIPIYGAGLWGQVWGYVAVAADRRTVIGAYFDHDSETPGLGGKIKDDPSFRAQFKDEILNIANPYNPFDIVKGGAPKTDVPDGKIDAITGATMTCKGLDAAIDTWIKAYIPYLEIAGEGLTNEL